MGPFFWSSFRTVSFFYILLINKKPVVFIPVGLTIDLYKKIKWSLGLKVIKANESHIAGMEAIHLQQFKQIGETEGDVEKYLKRSYNMSWVVIDESSNVVGYLIATNYGGNSDLEWFGASVEGKGVAQMLVDEYHKEAREKGIKQVFIYSRNRFKRAISFYLKNNYDITGLHRSADGDTMIQLNLKL